MTVCCVPNETKWSHCSQNSYVPKITRSPPSGGVRRNVTPVKSKTLSIFFTRKIWRRIWHCIIFNASKAADASFSAIFRTSMNATGSSWWRHIRQVRVLDKRVKFWDSCLNHSREIPPEAVGGSIFGSSFRYNFRPAVDSEVISGLAAVCLCRSVCNLVILG